MNHKKLVLLCMLGSIFHLSSTFAFVTNLSVWRLKNKQESIHVMLLGDTHQLCLADKQHKKTFLDQLKRLSVRSKETTLLLEFPILIKPKNPTEIANIDGLTQNNNILLLDALRDIAQCNRLLGSIFFDCCDNRGPQIQAIHDGYFAFPKKVYVPEINQEISIDMFDLLDDQIRNRWFDTEFSKYEKTIKDATTGRVVSPNVLHDYLDFILKNDADQFLESSPDGACKTILAQIKQKILDERKDVKLFFDTYAKDINDSTNDALLNYLKEAKSFSALDAQFQKIFNLCLHASDVTFVIAFSQAMAAKGDIIFYAGAAHTAVISDIMALLEKSDEATCIKKVGKSIEEQVRIISNKWHEVPNCELESCLKIFEGTCFACHKSVPSKKICGACKIAKYCSIECQKADWKEHKLVCKK